MTSTTRRSLWPVAVILVVALLLLPAALGFVYVRETNRPDLPELHVEPVDESVVRDFCTKCHAYPDPASFPRGEWAREVGQAYRFAAEAGLVSKAPPQGGVRRFFELNSPEVLQALPTLPDSPRWPVKFGRRNLYLDGSEEKPIVTSAKLVALSDNAATDLLVCDTATQRVLATDIRDERATWRVVAEGSYPVRVEVLDLDRDGRTDVVVSNMGTHFPTDDRLGSVVWHRATGGGRYTPVTLLEGIGRVVDTKAADFDGDGKPDLLVAVYGWRQTGEVILMWNRTTDWAEPRFEPVVIDPRHGALELAVADLNRDGKPDFVTAFGQEHEAVVAFFNNGRGGFTPQTVYAAPLPSYGLSGFQLADLDGDGDLDIVLTNGDILDPPSLLKPYHGLQWLENIGDARAFTHHPVAGLYGVMASAVADYDGDGDLDIAAGTYLPAREFPDREELRLPATVLYEQTARGQFTPHVLARGHCDTLACSAAVLPGDTLPSLIVGVGCFVNKDRPLNAVTVWRNRGRP